MIMKTADLYDDYMDEVQVAAPIFRDFGGEVAFHGRIATVKLHEDNSLVRQTLREAGNGRVLVIDGGGSLRCALVGDRLAQLAIDNAWAGLVVYGCIRDSADIGAMPIGVKALAAMPRKSVKRGAGVADIPVRFADVTFTPGHHLYADADGILVAAAPLQVAE